MPAWNKLGIVREKAGRRDDARQAYEKAVEAAPGYADALFNHAKISLLLGDRSTAGREVRALIAKHPDYRSALFLLAHVLLAEGDKPGAREALERFLGQAGPADPRTLESARETLKELGG